MAPQQGPLRRNGVIGFDLAPPPAPATPLPRNGLILFHTVDAPAPAPAIPLPRNGPIGFNKMPGPSSSTNPSSSPLINQGPPHRITPLVGPATAPSSSRSVQGSQSQRQISALNARLTDAEGIISRQESELDRAKSQASALRSQMASERRTTRLLDQHEMEAMIKQSTKSQSQNIEAQLRILEDQLDQTAENLELAEGKKKALLNCKQQLAKDQADLRDLRQIVAAAEYNVRRHERLTGAEDRVKGLLKNMENMLAAVMQDTRFNQAQTRNAQIAESSANPVGIAPRHVVRSQDLGSHGHAFDSHPPKLDKGKGRGPRTLGPEDSDVDGYLGPNNDVSGGSYRNRSESPSVLSDVMSLDSCRSSREASPIETPIDIRPSREGSPMDIVSSREGTPIDTPMDGIRSSREGSPMDITTEQELAVLQADESQVGDRNAAVQEALATTLTITPQQAEINDMMGNQNQLFYELPNANSLYFDGCIDWALDADGDVIMIDTPDDRYLLTRGEGKAITDRVAIASATPFPRNRNRVFKRHDRLTGSRKTWSSMTWNRLAWTPLAWTCLTGSPRRRRRQARQRVIQFVNPPAPVNLPVPVNIPVPVSLPLPVILPVPVNLQVPVNIPVPVSLPVRKRVAVMTEGPNRKKRITKELVEANGSLLLPLVTVYVMNTASNVLEESVPAVSQPAQSVHVSTEEVPTQAVMSEPAVSQPTLTVMEHTESVMTEQAVMSEPAVSQPTLTVLEYTETASTEQVPVPTEAAMSVPAVPQPTQAAQEATEQIPAHAALSEPAVSQPTRAASEEEESLETVQVPTKAVLSVPAVSKPTQAVLESTVPESSVLQCTSPASTVSIPSDEVVGAPAPSEPAPTKPAQTEPSSAEGIQSVPAVTKPTLNESDLTWQTEDEPVVGSLRTGTRSHLDVLLAMRAARTQARPTIMSSPEGLQVTAASQSNSASSLVASPEDASVKNAVATGTDSRAGVSKGTKRVEDANPTCSAQRTAGEQREKMGGEEAATSGLQMPGAWPSDPTAVTVSDESDMHEGSALLRGLWTGAGWVSFGVFVMVMVMLLSFPVWAGHLGHLVYTLEGPEQFLEELRWEHGYDVPFLERIIYVFLRCFAGDRTLFG
ncbi:hypothetical protein ACN38_g3252 [Penicillium nordicum]|uniref:Uncharacterized protein n=1 Tax=Penicillium nordicum TaxID=229535 RepID=A0A0N0RZI0_9EURO|nr:hypothetical protein ACN38_g3252 [Penicillium nordicum]